MFVLIIKKQKKMKNIFLLLCLGGLSTCWSSSGRDSLTGVSHKASDGCCEKNGGIYCGRLLKSCCKGECAYSWGMQVCSQNQNGEKQQGDDNCKTALSFCKDQNGIPCAVSVSTSKITCCAREKCVNPSSGGGLGGKIMEKVVDMALSKITMGVLGSGGLLSVSDIIGDDSDQKTSQKPKKQQKTNSKPAQPAKKHHDLTEQPREMLQHDLAVFDTLAQKFLGPNGKCKAGSIIKIPDDAAQDDTSDIVQARIGLFQG